jgi:hypothetical protein
MILLKFTDEVIANSHKIQEWILQFQEDDRNLVIDILKQIDVISLDDFSDIFERLLLKSVEKIKEDSSCKCNISIFPIRKFKKNELFWSSENSDAQPAHRSPVGNGSEDFIIKLISDFCKKYDFIESPSIKNIKEHKINNIILASDYNISGCQVLKFIELFFMNKSIKSYWSLNKIKIYVASVISTNNAIKLISDYKFFRKKSNIYFEHLFFEKEWKDYNKIKYMLDKYPQIPRKYRYGYKGTGVNIIFTHSIPNNIFGIFFYDNKNWSALFPKRRVPADIVRQIKDGVAVDDEKSEYAKKILNLIFHKNKTINTLSKKIGLSNVFTEIILEHLLKCKFISIDNGYYKITITGKHYLYEHILSHKRNIDENIDYYDYSIYIPHKWRGWHPV